MLECVENPEKERPYQVEFETSEFTALYEKTGQPIFATLEITYIPRETCIEQMSLKQYLKSFRDEKVYYEGVINQIADALVAVCDPKQLKVAGHFTVRGGITTKVVVDYDGRV
ncbi:MAG: 7-cyano-7-deazaguanine reductase [Candidatus Latescibacterota bacterium]|jgi:7-cyano-7-deazaguanine reductase